MIELVIAVSFAVIISAGCSLFEAVFLSTPIRHIETIIQKGKPSGWIFKKLREDVERPINAILSLNTIAHTAGAAVAGSAATAVFGHHNSKNSRSGLCPTPYPFRSASLEMVGQADDPRRLVVQPYYGVDRQG
jgi:CBS domain containing-hemolysin-like protein